MKEDFELLLPPPDGKKSLKDAFFEGIGEMEKHASMISRIALIRFKTPLALEPPSFFGLWLRPLGWYEDRVLPLNPQHQSQMVARFSALVEGLIGGRVNQSERQMLWEAFRTGPGPRLRNQYQGEKFEAHISIVEGKDWPGQ